MYLLAASVAVNLVLGLLLVRTWRRHQNFWVSIRLLKDLTRDASAYLRRWQDEPNEPVWKQNAVERTDAAFDVAYSLLNSEHSVVVVHPPALQNPITNINNPADRNKKPRVEPGFDPDDDEGDGWKKA
jgi:hypothetical protein